MPGRASDFPDVFADRPLPSLRHSKAVTVMESSSVGGRVKALGGRILNGPMDVPGGDRVVQCMDPQRAAFALHQATSA